MSRKPLLVYIGTKGNLGTFFAVRHVMAFCCRKQVSSTKTEAEKDGVQVPTTLAEYCVSTKPKPPESHVDMADFYDDDYMEDDEEDEEDPIYDDDEDSGNEES